MLSGVSDACMKIMASLGHFFFISTNNSTIYICSLSFVFFTDQHLFSIKVSAVAYEEDDHQVEKQIFFCSYK